MTFLETPSATLKSEDETLQLPPTDVLFGVTALMKDVRKKIELVSAADVPVLLQGESGTGKELCALLIHRLSRHSEAAFVKVNCLGITDLLMETELFGHEIGAFAGADSLRKGRLDQAHHGTLLLDEIGSLTLDLQSRLLQVLQDRIFFRVGGRQEQAVSTRVISISIRDMRQQVEAGTFRLDFFHRINAVTISVPPLRQRSVDIPQLVEYLASRHSHQLGISRKTISKGLVQLMQVHDWPGNIRQLDNLMRSYVLIGDENLILSELAPRSVRIDEIAAEIDISKPFALKTLTKTATRDLERQIILKVLHANHWNRQKTAKWLQISYRSLLYKLSEIGLHEYPQSLAHTMPDRGAAEFALGLAKSISSTGIIFPKVIV